MWEVPSHTIALNGASKLWLAVKKLKFFEIAGRKIVNKVRKVFIAWFLIAFLGIVTPVAIASGQTSPSLSVGSPVVFNGQTLFMIRDNFGTISPQGRRIRAERRIAEFAANYWIPLEDLHINAMDGDGIPVDVIVAGDQTIHFIRRD
jgi:hypothetical protein